MHAGVNLPISQSLNLMYPIFQIFIPESCPSMLAKRIIPCLDVKDGRHDSIFQQFTPDGQRYMDYVHDYGSFADVPRERFIAELRRRGVSILLVEQNARAALQVADYAYVLETGSVAMEGPARTLADDPRVIETYLGLGGKHQDMLAT